MEVSMEDKKQEAITRMKMIGIYPQTIMQFEKEGLVSISEPPFGAFFWTNEQETKEVRNFEETYNALVYVVIRSYTKFGTIDSYLYVSDYREEWEDDRLALKEKEPIVYCLNHDTPYFSEFGLIGIELTGAAGLRRIS